VRSGLGTTLEALEEGSLQFPFDEVERSGGKHDRTHDAPALTSQGCGAGPSSVRGQATAQAVGKVALAEGDLR
jgi:hypothetical protein